MAVHPRMPNAVERASVPSTSPSSRRLISRFTSPFGQKSRNICDYYIDLDDPHKQHSPGDTISGSVKFRVLKAIRITHLVVSLHGFVQVYKTPGAPPADGHRAYLGNSRSKKSGEYFGNGFATLFEDEVVLCGDGRLAEGPYQFNFILEFPDRDLPSNIEFERGTVSYMITSTFTRPTTIAPTLHCDRHVRLIERIDISKLYPPKARTITLEPLPRRSRARHQARKAVDDRRSRRQDSDPNSDDRRGSQASSSNSARTEAEPPRSPTPSDISFDSLGSASLQDSTASGRQSDSTRVNGSRVSLSMKTITATVQSLAGGCLPGDNIPVRININHTKHVKSLYGVIITLYRQARVDLHPAIPLGPTEKGKESKYEDYYPKSLTGLGGLSLSGAGSSHVFRKDLAQVILPLLVDPRTLTAEINGKIRVPEDAFPTISTVPGSMISFRYYVEVVLDIQGKLSNSNGGLGSLSGFAGTTNSPHGAEGSEWERASYNNFGPPIVDTASIRRDKGVVACTFETIVGSVDSARRKGKKKVEQSFSSDASEDQQPSSRRSSPPEHTVPTIPESAPLDLQANTTAGAEFHSNGGDYGHGWYEDDGYDQAYDFNYDQYWYHGGSHGFTDSYDHTPVPLPTIEDESNLSEKERLRRAEARLLPSQPPLEEAEETDASASALEATAPYIPGEYFPNNHDEYVTPLVEAGSSRRFRSASGYHDISANAPAYEHVSQSAASYMSGMINERNGQTNFSKAPMTEQARPGAAIRSTTMTGVGTAGSGPHETIAPTAQDAALYADANDSHADASASHGLPRYEN